MPRTQKQGKKKVVPPAPVGVHKKKTTAPHPLIEKKTRTYGIGGHLQPRRDLTRYVRWPKYIRLQRQRRILLQRLSVPPVIAQFQNVLDKNGAQLLFKLLDLHRPETKKEKQERLKKIAAAKVAAGKLKEGAQAPAFPQRPISVKCGLNRVTQLIESGKAKLVVIAHDVDPIELVMFLPALCRKKEIPYCIVKGKSRLGSIVDKKTATCLAFTQIKPQCKNEFKTLTDMCDGQFRTQYTAAMKRWGGGIMGHKHRVAVAKLEKRKAAEVSKK